MQTKLKASKLFQQVVVNQYGYNAVSLELTNDSMHSFRMKLLSSILNNKRISFSFKIRNRPRK